MNLNNDAPVIYQIEPKPLVTVLRFPFLFGSLNTLLRTHRWKRSELRDKYFYLIRSMTTHQHKGRVRIEYSRSSSASRKMDYDNLVSSVKVVTDALVKAGVIVDDNQNIIVEQTHEHVLTSRNVLPFTVIKITDL